MVISSWISYTLKLCISCYERYIPPCSSRRHHTGADLPRTLSDNVHHWLETPADHNFILWKLQKYGFYFLENCPGNCQPTVVCQPLGGAGAHAAAGHLQGAAAGADQ